MKKILFILALLMTIAQGVGVQSFDVWDDDWKGGNE